MTTLNRATQIVLSLGLLTVFTTPCFAPPGRGEVESFGFELEVSKSGVFALSNFRPQTVSHRRFREVLDMIRPVAGSVGRIEDKTKNDGDRTYNYIESSEGWIIEPEWVRGFYKDGFEVVSPGLELSEGDMAEKVIKRLIADGGIDTGMMSSFQMTFKVDASPKQRLNLYLFLENYAPQILAATSPTRYGHIVNRFAIPLSVNQPDLVAELEALRGQRTVTDAEIHAVFERHRAKEQQIWGRGNDGFPQAPFKYRAWAAHKFFGLTEGDNKKGFIEFRIADVVGPKQATAMFELYLAACKKGLNWTGSFSNPWGGTGRNLQIRNDATAYDSTIGSLDRKVAGSSGAEYSEFLRVLGLSEGNYPKLGRIAGEAFPTTSNFSTTSSRSISGSGRSRTITIAGNEAELRGLVSRIGDALYIADAGEGRETMRRKGPGDLSADREAYCQMTRQGGEWKIILRGNSNLLTTYSQQLVANTENGYRAYTEFQSLAHQSEHGSLLETVDAFVKELGMDALDSRERQKIGWIENKLGGAENILPIHNFELSPFASTLDQTQIRNANFKFITRVLRLARGRKRVAENPISYLKSWVRDSGMEKVVQRSLTTVITSPDAALIGPTLRKAVATGNGEVVNSFSSAQQKEMAKRYLSDAEIRQLASLSSTRGLRDIIDSRSNRQAANACSKLRWEFPAIIAEQRLPSEGILAAQ